MKTITAILEPAPDGTVHLPVPPELRGGKVEVTANLKAAGGLPTDRLRATPEMVARRKAAYKGLRESGGLSGTIPDPVTWQRELRLDRPLPGRD